MWIKYWQNQQNRKEFAVTTRNWKQRRCRLKISGGHEGNNVATPLWHSAPKRRLCPLTGKKLTSLKFSHVAAMYGYGTLQQ